MEHTLICMLLHHIYNCNILIATLINDLPTITLLDIWCRNLLASGVLEGVCVWGGGRCVWVGGGCMGSLLVLALMELSLTKNVLFQIVNFFILFPFFFFEQRKTLTMALNVSITLSFLLNW